MDRQPLATLPDLGSAAGGRFTLADVALIVAGAVCPFLFLQRLDAGFAGLWWLPVVVVIRSDLRSFIIPDSATLAIAALGILHALADPIVHDADLRTIALNVACSLAGGAAAFGVFWLTGRVFRRLCGRDSLGFGDVKLAGACAVWLDVGDQAAALQIAAIAAILLVAVHRGAGGSSAAVPFGAFMAPSAWAVFVAGPSVHGLIEAMS